MTAIVLLVLFVHTSHAVPPQRTEAADTSLNAFFEFPDPHPFAFVIPYIPFHLLYYETEIKDFIRSDTFKTIRTSLGDLRAVDAIYVRAYALASGNTAVALLLSSIACFDHEILEFDVPVLSLCLPLTSECREDFFTRVRRLPGQLYPDSPGTSAGDRDKLQHFFGSAFLAYVFDSDSSAERFGSFVEIGENAIIREGTYDLRDIRANRNGQAFAAALGENNKRYPSAFFR